MSSYPTIYSKKGFTAYAWAAVSLAFSRISTQFDLSSSFSASHTKTLDESARFEKKNMTLKNTPVSRDNLEGKILLVLRLLERVQARSEYTHDTRGTEIERILAVMKSNRSGPDWSFYIASILLHHTFSEGQTTTEETSAKEIVFWILELAARLNNY